MNKAGSIANDWASSGELAAALRAGGGRRVALEQAVRSAIRTGRLRAGDPLPSMRALARELGIARGTVSAAYTQLAAEGYLSGRPGAAARVAAHAAPLSLGDPLPPSVHGKAAALAAPRVRFSLDVGVPDVTAFPRAEWVAALRRALQIASHQALTVPDAQGREELRAALEGHLRRTRGVLAEPDQIVVCCGIAHGLAVLLRALRDAGATTVAMEDPCLPQHRTMAAEAGLRVVPMVVDSQGAAVDLPAGVGAALVTPAHQFPLGPTLAAQRRAALATWARENDALIIEDDYDGEYRYDHRPVGALQGLDPDRIVYAGTVSKTLAPGLRIGWLVLPRRLVAPVVGAKHISQGEVSALEQLALAEFLRSGAHDRHVRRMRQRYRRRRDLLLALLSERAPRLHPRGIAAGLHLVVDLPPGTDEDATAARAAALGLAINVLRPYWHDPTGKPPGLLIGYAAPADHAYAQTLAALAEAFDPPD